MLLVHVIGSADKFYSLEQTSEHQVTIRYGRRLTAGVMSEKQFTSAAEVSVQCVRWVAG